MAQEDDPNLLFFLLVAGGAIAGWRFWSQRESPEAREHRIEEEARQKREVEVNRSGIIGIPIPRDIGRAMRDYLRAGTFHGEEHSPLAYVGYRVGRTQGLPLWDRKRRLKICFGVVIPERLGAKYQAWGRPATAQRFNSIRDHLRMLANLRRHRANFEYAVAEWEADEEWFRSEYSDLAVQLQRHGYRA